MKTFYTFLLCFTFSCLHAQLESANWYFGVKAGLDFSSGTPEVVYDGAMSTGEGCASISDPDGNLLFYTDGTKVYNREHITMPNGNFLLGNSSSTQSAIVIPYPNDLNKYYIFTVGADDMALPNNTNNTGFNYYIVDMSLNDGLGDVLPYNAPQNKLMELTSEKVTAVAHANGQDFWVLTHFEDKFHAYLVTEEGVNTTPVISQIGPYIDPDVYPVNARGYLKLSPNGKKVGIAHLTNLLLEDIPEEVINYEPYYTNMNFANTYNGYTAVYDFDDETGMVSNEITLSEVGSPYGLEFSSESNYLYFAYDYHEPYDENPSPAWLKAELIQYDLNASDIANSAIVIFDEYTPNYQTFTARGALQLALDQKIYYSPTLYSGSVYFGHSLSIIHSPNSAGTAANFEYEALKINSDENPNHYLSFGLPPFLTSFFRAGIEFNGEILNSGTCLGNAISFSVNSNQEILSINWNFGDGNTSTELNPTHTYALPGTYTVEAIVITTHETLTLTRDVSIHPYPDAVNAHLTQCDFNGDGLAFFDLSLADELVTTETGNTISYHLTMEDAMNGENELTSPYFNLSNPQTLYVRVRSPQSCVSYSELTLSTYEVEIQTVSDIAQCDLENDGFEFFNLEDKNSEIEALYTETVQILSFHESVWDAEMNLNPLNLPYQNSSNPQTIYVRVQTSGCVEIVSFQLILYELPFINLSNHEICPDSVQPMDAGSGFSSYQWHGLQGSDLNQPLDQQTVVISIPGEYSVTVTNEENCEFQDFFSISVSEIPSISEIVISGDGSATIHASGTPEFEYSLDGIFWQSSNVFHGLTPGDYSVYVRDGNGCISLKENFGVLEIPNFISPNKDGKNDSWVIKGISHYPDVHIRIFDRYGKLFVDRLNHKNSEVWDGTYLGRVVNSGSYWYIIQLSDGRKYVGALAVKNY